MRLRWGRPPWDVLGPLVRGAPTLYDRFLATVAGANLTTTVLPLPMPSILAARLLAMTAWKVDLIYLDASHERGETLVSDAGGLIVPT
jgi:hypothetical protein